MAREVLKEFFEKYIQGTPYKGAVEDRKIFLCHLTNAVCFGVEIDKKAGRVYITSRALKHLFDKKPAEEFFFIIDNLHKVVKYPDKIYKNKTGKRGEYCLIKRIGDSEYLYSIEIYKIPPAILGVCVLGLSSLGQNSTIEEVQIATAFRLRDNDYIKKYTLLWSWGNGAPHRSAFDTPKGTTCAPQ